MIVIDSLAEWKAIRKSIDNNKKIGFVPTMGHLHEGHRSLLTTSQMQNDVTVLSIFVNPTQFNDKGDFEKYTKTLDEDLRMAESAKVDFVLAPKSNEIYCDQYNYQITEKIISPQLEGEYRPGHFEGVLTVVMKLFSLVQPHRAYFGEKDYQQLCLIQGLVDAFFLEIEIVPCPTVREKNGLAMSSRNGRLTEIEREKAALFYACLSASEDEIAIEHALQKHGFIVEYIKKWQGRLVGAIKLGEVRLIDNRRIEST